MIAVLTIILVLRTLIFVALSATHYLQADPHRYSTGRYSPRVSIIVPCYNEEMTLSNCVESLLSQTYKNFEIILVNDGSTDSTETLCEHLARTYPQTIKIYSKKNAGKASALNYGIACSIGDIIVTVDADSVFQDTTLVNLVSSFNDSTVAAVAGNVKVANRGTVLGALQAAEYILGLNMYRRAFAQIGCIPVISGAVGAFRKEALLAVGGYSSDTLVEDMDLTLALAKKGYRTIYNEWAIAYTEAPEQISQLYRQRYRWTFGGLQVVKKYRHMLFNPAYGTMGMVSLPYFMFSSFLSVSLSLLLVLSVVSPLFGAGFVPFLSIFLVYMGTQCVLLAFALVLDNEDKKLLRTCLIDVVFGNLFLSFVTVRALIAHVQSKEASWNPLQRFGKNIALA